MSDPNTKFDINSVEVLTPNLKRRLSGVTATIARLVPIQADQISIAAIGPGLPAGLPHISISRLFLLPKQKLRVWHARRNTEMLLGLFLRHMVRLNLALLFTSASQRHHTRFTRWLISKMDDVIATSEKTAAYLLQPASVIHHGIDTERFCPCSDQADLRGNLGLPNGVLIGCYGRIRHQKGTDAFVSAMIELLPAMPDHHALVMGRATQSHAEFLTSLKQRVADAGLSDRIHFLPEVPVDQMPAWYQVLDLFVAPQRWEGFGLTPLEAMSCGVPAVATRVGAFEELIVDGKTGNLVAPDDVPSLTAATREYLEEPDMRRSSSIAAREHVVANFGLEREAAKIIGVYRDLLDAPVLRCQPRLFSLNTLIKRLEFQFEKRLPGSSVQERSADTADLMQELAGKTVSIVGNARALGNGNNGADIDLADIVIRINRAPRPAKKSHGLKTGWLALATDLPIAQARKLRPNRVLWMSPKTKRIPFWAIGLPGFFVHPQTQWQRLNDQLQSPPTTGLMIIDLIRSSDAKTVKLYGFDFFASKSLTGRRDASQVPHDFSAELAFVSDILANDPRFHLIPSSG